MPLYRQPWLIVFMLFFSVMGCTQIPETPSPIATVVASATPTATNTVTVQPSHTAVLSTPTPTPTAVPTYTPAPISGEVFYVALEGNDRQGDGSSARPWATITHAVQTVPDGATILVRPGVYFGRVDLNGIFTEGITIRSEIPYHARLRHDDIVVLCALAQGITIEGFDIAHIGPGARRYIMQIQDLLSTETGGTASVSRITLRNNILHDSYDIDILKLNNGASDIVVEDNIFYNQGPLGHHIDVNSVTDVVIQDNIFFNDFTASGRANNHNTGSFVTIHDSNAAADRNLGSKNITLRRNVFLNWEGRDGSSMIAIGASEVSFHQAENVLIENNLLLGNGLDPVLSAFGINGSRDIMFRNNTISGDLPAFSYAFRLNMQINNRINQKISFYNNIWSDQTGTMGALNADSALRFSDSNPEETETFNLLNNLYWNGGLGLPLDPTQLVNYTDDNQRVIGDPYLNESFAKLTLPVWNADIQRFADGSSFVHEAFVRLVEAFARPVSGSMAIDAADPAYAADEDILGRPRPSSAPDIGAYEVIP